MKTPSTFLRLLLLVLLVSSAAMPPVQADCPEDLGNCQRELGITYDDLHICSSENEVLKNTNIRLAAQNDYLAQENTQLFAQLQGYLDTIQALNDKLAGISNILMTPADSDFGPVTVSATSRAQIITVTANQATTLGTITLAGTHGSDFARGGTCADGAVLAQNANCTVAITFTPSDTGSRNATLTVTTSSPVATLKTNLTGTGTIAVSSLLVDPVTPSTLFAGVDGKGIYRSTDSGGDWAAAPLAPVNPRIKALVITPGDRMKLFAATYGGGVYRSTDNGASWSSCSNTGLLSRNVLSLVTSPTGKLYAGTEGGVYTSPDCDTWTPVNNGLP